VKTALWSARRATSVVLVLVFATLIARPVWGQRAGAEIHDIDRADASLVARGLDGLRDLAGRPIRAISVETAGKRWKTTRTVRSVAIGTPLSADVARRAIDELLATGAFAQAFADARPFEDGVILRIVVVPRRVVATINVRGANLDVRRTLSAAEIAEDDEITEKRLDEIRTAIRRHYRRSGYDAAKVTIEARDTAEPLEVILDVDIEPGDQRRVARRIFVIEPKYDRVVGDLKYEYGVARDDPVDEDALIEADNDMAETLRSAGFLDAAVNHRLLRKDADVFLYVYLETGPRYRFVFLGNRRRDVADLEKALDLAVPGADASPETLVERLEQDYRERGFFDVRVTAQTRTQNDDAEIEITFTIREGQLVRVHRRLFPCLPLDAPDGLGASDLGGEINGVLEETFPETPLLHEVNAAVVDPMLSPGGSRADARRLSPAFTYTPEAYQRALAHLEEYLASKGYLNAVVGPVTVIRAECATGVGGEACRPIPLPPVPEPICARDARDLPVPEPPLPEDLTCVPDPKRSIHCAPDLILHIPVQLGPETRLYDILFEGNEVISSRELLEVADFPLGAPFSNLELDAAQARVLNAYRDRGYHYASVGTTIDWSPDRTRARARFVISERQPVEIDSYEIRGASRTDHDLILSRLALCQNLDDCADEGKDNLFRRNLVRQSEEQIATLGTFSSVAIALEDAHIPQRQKRVIITVSELPSQYIEPSGGFYTGDGFRVGFEYGHRNIGGQAIALTVRLEFSYLPEFLILDEGVRENYQNMSVSQRLERRNTASLRFPDVGLGPKVDLVISGIDARDNQRNFGLTREAVLPALNWRPARELTFQLGVSAEVNEVTLFGAENVEAAVRNNPALARLLRVPDGRTIAIAQRLTGTWDRRDKPLEATRGTLVSATVEHVSAFPLDEETQITSEFIKFSGRIGGYIPLGETGAAVALSIGAGYNLQLTADSETYPDRLFFLGGVNTVRGFQLDALVPEDIAQRIVAGEIDIGDVGVRGGDTYVNPRLELRIPLTSLLSLGLFLDTGNVWSDPDSIKSFADLFRLRYTAGPGVRINTPLGPIAIDYGFKLQRYEWEDLGALHFAIGLF
jgi:outer membrane protein insertion porin family